MKFHGTIKIDLFEGFVSIKSNKTKVLVPTRSTIYIIEMTMQNKPLNCIFFGCVREIVRGGCATMIGQPNASVVRLYFCRPPRTRSRRTPELKKVCRTPKIKNIPPFSQSNESREL